jgi:hypothetical protein
MYRGSLFSRDKIPAGLALRQASRMLADAFAAAAVGSAKRAAVISHGSISARINNSYGRLDYRLTQFY